MEQKRDSWYLLTEQCIYTTHSSVKRAAFIDFTFHSFSWTTNWANSHFLCSCSTCSLVGGWVYGIICLHELNTEQWTFKLIKASLTLGNFKAQNCFTTAVFVHPLIMRCLTGKHVPDFGAHVRFFLLSSLDICKNISRVGLIQPFYSKTTLFPRPFLFVF